MKNVFKTVKQRCSKKIKFNSLSCKQHHAPLCRTDDTHPERLRSQLNFLKVHFLAFRHSGNLTERIAQL